MVTIPDRQMVKIVAGVARKGQTDAGCDQVGNHGTGTAHGETIDDLYINESVLFHKYQYLSPTLCNYDTWTTCVSGCVTFLVSSRAIAEPIEKRVQPVHEVALDIVETDHVRVHALRPLKQLAIRQRKLAKPVRARLIQFISEVGRRREGHETLPAHAVTRVVRLDAARSQASGHVDVFPEAALSAKAHRQAMQLSGAAVAVVLSYSQACS